MKEMTIRLRSFQDIRDLSAIAGKMNFPVLLIDEKREGNAKSLMSMFGLNLRQNLTVQADCDDDDFEVFRTLAGRFEVGSNS